MYIKRKEETEVKADAQDSGGGGGERGGRSTVVQ